MNYEKTLNEVYPGNAIILVKWEHGDLK